MQNWRNDLQWLLVFQVIYKFWKGFLLVCDFSERSFNIQLIEFLLTKFLGQEEIQRSTHANSHFYNVDLSRSHRTAWLPYSPPYRNMCVWARYSADHLILFNVKTVNQNYLILLVESVRN